VLVISVVHTANTSQPRCPLKWIHKQASLGLYGAGSVQIGGGDSPIWGACHPESRPNGDMSGLIE